MTLSRLGLEASMDPKRVRAGQLMQRRVFCVPPQMPVRELAKKLDRRGLEGGVVVDGGGNLLGVVSKSDVYHYQREGTRGPDALAFFRQHLIDGLSAASPADVPDLARVRDIMRPSAVEFPENASVDRIAQAMRRRRLLRVLITSGRKVRGLLTAMDLLKLLES
ncbi:MAG: hypothetical protein A2X36_10640 [Elusimicrobia bacterium GWA2_69_24]|nr:MAG: hypothetical protein A2X36_10640 [Elusimicrobia bacterium GWA2_69_24]